MGFNSGFKGLNSLRHLKFYSHQYRIYRVDIQGGAKPLDNVGRKKSLRDVTSSSFRLPALQGRNIPANVIVQKEDSLNFSGTQ